MTLDKDLHKRMLTLATNLLEATKVGKISWALTDKENRFLYAGTSSSVTVELTTDRDGDNHTTLSLLNSRGTTVDSIQSEYEPAGPDRWTAASWNEILDDLYYAARRVAHNVDEAIESMLTDIERGTPSPSADGYSDEPPF